MKAISLVSLFRDTVVPVLRARERVPYRRPTTLSEQGTRQTRNPEPKTTPQKDPSPRQTPKWLKPCKWGAYLTIISSSLYSAWNTATGNWEINNLAALLRVTTKASGFTIPPPPQIFPEYVLDAFIGKTVDPNEVKESMISTNIDPKEIDMNGDYIIANTPEEVKKLAEKLKSSSSNLSERLLDANTYSEIIFPPKSVKKDQGGELDCYNMAMIEGLDDQSLKGMFRVIDFDNDTSAMIIGVAINGEEIELNRLGKGGIVKWLSSSHFDSSQSGEHLLVPAITLACERAFNEQKLFGFISLPPKYQPWRLPPGYANTLTGKPHSAILTKNLTKTQLRELLTNADKTVITLAKLPTWEDITGTYKEPGLFQKLDIQEKRGYSPSKEASFETSFQCLVQRVESEKKQCLANKHTKEDLVESSTNVNKKDQPVAKLVTSTNKDVIDHYITKEAKEKLKDENKQKEKPLRPITELTTNHVYFVADGKDKNANKIEDNSRRFSITDDEILSGNFVIVVENKYLGHFPVGPLIGGLIGVIATNIGSRVVRKKLA